MRRIIVDTSAYRVVVVGIDEETAERYAMTRVRQVAVMHHSVAT